MRDETAKTCKRTDAFYLSILLTAALCIGVYLIVSTAVVAQDSVTFINYAQQLEENVS